MHVGAAATTILWPSPTLHKTNPLTSRKCQISSQITTSSVMLQTQVRQVQKSTTRGSRTHGARSTAATSNTKTHTWHTHITHITQPQHPAKNQRKNTIGSKDYPPTLEAVSKGWTIDSTIGLVRKLVWQFQTRGIYLDLRSSLERLITTWVNSISIRHRPWGNGWVPAC